MECYAASTSRSLRFVVGGRLSHAFRARSQRDAAMTCGERGVHLPLHVVIPASEAERFASMRSIASR